MEMLPLRLMLSQVTACPCQGSKLALICLVSKHAPCAWQHLSIVGAAQCSVVWQYICRLNLAVFVLI